MKSFEKHTFSQHRKYQIRLGSKDQHFYWKEIENKIQVLIYKTRN
jgi:hypothetical protein